MIHVRTRMKEFAWQGKVRWVSGNLQQSVLAVIGRSFRVQAASLMGCYPDVSFRSTRDRPPSLNADGAPLHGCKSLVNRWNNILRRLVRLVRLEVLSYRNTEGCGENGGGEESSLPR